MESLYIDTPSIRDKNGTAERRRHAEEKMELLQFCCNQAWTKSGGRIPWNVTVICERPVKAPSMWKESFTWNIPWICIVMLVAFGKETL